jgi:hypothetical protein
LNAGVATGIVLYEALRQRSLVSAEKKSKPKEIELKKQK